MLKLQSLIMAFISLITFVFYGPPDMQNPDRLEVNTGKETLVVGVISDTQLLSKESKHDSAQFEENFRTSLKVLKARDVDMILFPGDIGDAGTKEAFERFKAIYEEVFPADDENQPILQLIMGNHDYWADPNITLPHLQRNIYREVFERSPWSHYVVNGVHFIGASPMTGVMTTGYVGAELWLDREIRAAEADNPDMPIFVMTHNQPKNTSYGSNDWGDTALPFVFKNHPNVVNLSGHVHYSLLDERSIWQGDYTVINTQSISYTEMEEGKENGTIPPNADQTPMGYIIEINKDNFSIARINFAKGGEMGYEEKADMRWTFDLPYSKDSFKYTDARRNTNKAPEMEAGKGSFEVEDGKTVLKFKAGTDDDFVHSYKLVIDDSEEQLYFSDFYNGLDDMAEEVSLPLLNVKAGTHNIKVYAVDSYDAVSENFAEIENVVVY